jgi:hypothetical protein
MDTSAYLILWTIFAISTVVVAEKRGGHPLVWFFLAVVFGPLAFIIALTAGKRCGHCLAWIPKEAGTCSQ